MSEMYFYINPKVHKNFMKDKLSIEIEILEKGHVYPVIFERSDMLLPRIEFEGRRYAGLHDIKDFLHEIMGDMIKKGKEIMN